MENDKAQKNGLKFEIYVEQLFKDLGKLRVRRNVQYHLLKWPKKEEVKIVQIDVQFYDLLGKHIVECKYMSNGTVNDDVVNKVKKNMDYLGIERAVIATNQDFHVQAKRLAKKYEIELCNKEKLEKIDYERRSIVGMMLYRFQKKSLEEQIDKINEKKYANNAFIERKYVL
jgi:hypothetical protein